MLCVAQPMYTLDDLLSIVQASEAELEQGLKARNAVVIDGKQRLRWKHNSASQSKSLRRQISHV